jgi:hypothetical protein
VDGVEGVIGEGVEADGGDADDEERGDGEVGNGDAADAAEDGDGDGRAGGGEAEVIGQAEAVAANGGDAGEQDGEHDEQEQGGEDVEDYSGAAAADMVDGLVVGGGPQVMAGFEQAAAEPGKEDGGDGDARQAGFAEAGEEMDDFLAGGEPGPDDGAGVRGADADGVAQRP